MRSLVLATLLLTACDSSESVTRTTEAGPDDFSSFRYSWYGTGSSGSFAMDRDCGIEAEGYLSFAGGGVPKGAGVVTETDCRSFKSLVLSGEVLDALARYGTAGSQCTLDTDDYTSMTVSLMEGPNRSVDSVSGCSGTEPFTRVSKEAARLANKYIASSDAGTD